MNHDANRLMIVDLPHPTLDDAWRDHLARHAFGGVCLFRRNIQHAEQLLNLVEEIREVLGPDALIGIDQEGGTVLRVLDVPQPPSLMALGAVGDAEVAREMGGVTARGLLAFGINWNFAPVLDVNNNPRNPVIGERSFGSDPLRVAELGAAWTTGLQEAGVMASVKHFPGHGDTSTDSHLALPTVDKPLAELEACEWLPFRHALRSGADSVMTAHILYPALDPARPATLSPRILTDLLRDAWGYDGIIVTDSTDMQAIAAHHPNGEAAPLALQAGADAILACTHGNMHAQEQQASAIGRAVREGHLRPERIHESLRRLRRAATRYPGTPAPLAAEQRARDEQAAYEANLRAVTRVGEARLPAPADRVLLVTPTHAAVGGPYEDSLTGEALHAALKPAFADLQVLAYDPAHPHAAREALLTTPTDFILFATTGRWELAPAEVELAHAARSRGTPTLHLALWNPYHTTALDLPALVTYGFRDNTLRALRAILTGHARPTGTLPFRAAEPLTT